MNPTARVLLPAAVLLAAAVSSFGHGDEGVLDLEAIDARIDAQLAVTAGREHRAYAAVARVIRRENHHEKLSVDIRKLIATLRKCTSGALTGDAELRAALA